jgi:hypothetical protein
MNEQKEARGIHHKVEAEEAIKMSISEDKERHAREIYTRRVTAMDARPPGLDGRIQNSTNFSRLPV